jgi:hypothetical protein
MLNWALSYKSITGIKFILKFEFPFLSTSLHASLTNYSTAIVSTMI